MLDLALAGWLLDGGEIPVHESNRVVLHGGIGPRFIKPGIHPFLIVFDDPLVGFSGDIPEPDQIIQDGDQINLMPAISGGGSIPIA